jgi:hypothetical protein
MSVQMLIDRCIQELQGAGLLAVQMDVVGHNVAVARPVGCHGRSFEKVDEFGLHRYDRVLSPLLRVKVSEDGIVVRRRDGYGGLRPEDFFLRFSSVSEATQFIVKYMLTDEKLPGVEYYG